MGTQSLTHPPCRTSHPLRIALLTLLSLLTCQAQTPVPATSIPLILPSAIVFDPSGNLYLAETSNHVIRKVDPTGNITTIAGTATQGFSGDNALATAAQLDSPQGLALDTANNLYIADTHNHRIRRLNLTTGLIVTIAGTGIPGFSGDNGPATAARLDLPTALAVDTQNNLYLADTANHRIRKINLSTGLITTLAGTGTQGYSGDNAPAIAASIDSPTGIALDAANNLYLADTHNHRIRRISASTGLITTLAGTGAQGYSGDNAPAATATLALPHGLTIDAAGNLYLADTANHRIRRIDTTTGLITTLAGTGTQTYSGDNAPATVAALDTPRAVTLSAASLLTLADTGNQRIRQLSAPPAATIRTIAGLGLATPEALTLTSPAAIPYGTGTLTANLATPTPATGLITFLDTFPDTVNAVTSTLASIPLTADTAALDTSTLPAGQHRITATYPGDPVHASTQSPTVPLTILPQQLTLALTSISVLYGQPIPSINGTLTGILPRDATALTASFTTAASTLSPTGVYPITAALTGPAAGNYAVSPSSASLTILPASTLITFTANAATPNAFTSHVATTTTGSPTGTVTLLDGASPLLTAPLSITGDATLTAASLTPGPHTLIAAYSGDANFTPSASTPTPITIGPTTGPDFTLAATGPTSQTVVSGSSASFTFSVQLQGNLASPITLAATGLPNLATASFNPAYLPPGATAATFTLTISTPKTTALQRTPALPPLLWSLLLFPLTGIALRPRRRPGRSTLYAPTILTALATLGFALTLCSGCGDRTATGNALTTSSTTPYAITVTGTATATTLLQHSATVTLSLSPAN
jgi:hypothetical protein